MTAENVQEKLEDLIQSEADEVVAPVQAQTAAMEDALDMAGEMQHSVTDAGLGNGGVPVAANGTDEPAANHIAANGTAELLADEAEAELPAADVPAGLPVKEVYIQQPAGEAPAAEESPQPGEEAPAAEELPADVAAEQAVAEVAADAEVAVEEVLAGQPALEDVSAAAEELQQGVADASGAADQEVPAPQESEPACPIDVRGIMGRAVAAVARDAEVQPSTPEPAAPSPTMPTSSAGPARPSGLGGSGLGGGLPARPARPAGLGGSGGLPALPARKVAAKAPPANPPASQPAASQVAAVARAPAASAPAPGARSGGIGAAAAVPSAPSVNPNAEDPEEPQNVRELRRKVQQTRVLLVRAALRLGATARSSIVQQVIYRLDLAERIHHPQRSQAAQRTRGAATFEAAVEEATAQEARGPTEALAVRMTVLVVGPLGSGKSETIASLLDGQGAGSGAAPAATNKVRVVEGSVRGIPCRFIDTPGLNPAASQLATNLRSLNSIKAAYKKHKPDIVLYVDRLDVVRRDMGDLTLLRTITEKFGASLWFNTILVLTHAGAELPEGNNGPMAFDLYAQSRMHMLQNGVRQAAGDMRLLNPVALAENDPSACTEGPNGEMLLLHDAKPWKQHLMLLMLSSKLLSDADSLLDIQGSTQGQQSRAMQFLRGMQQKLPPIPYLLSNFIGTKHPRKAPEDEREIKRDDELGELALEQRKEEVRKKREFLRQRAEEARQEEGSSQVAVPAPDPALAPSFDPDCNTHRYRFLESAGGWIARPFVESQGLDHDDGIDGFSVERSAMLRSKGQHLGGVPAFVMAQLHKDKTQFSLQSEAEASVHHTSKHVTTATADLQTIGQDMLYTSKVETRLKVHPKDKLAVGLLASRLKEGYGPPTKGPVAVGMKLENKLKVRPNAKLTMGVGSMTTKTRAGRDTAHAASAEMKIRGAVDQSSQLLVGGSMMHFRKDLALGGNMAGQFNATPETQVSSRFSLNSKGTGQMVLRVASHDHPQLGYALLVPILGALVNKIRGSDEMY